MAIARVQLPDGRIARFEVDEGSSPQQILTHAENYFGRGVTKTPDFGPETMKQSMAKAGEEMGFGQSVIAGAGTRVNDYAMRLKQLLGQQLTTQEQADVVAGRAATGPAAAGRIASDVGAGAAVAPASLLGQIAAGGVQGFTTNPVLPGESGLRNARDAAVGGGLGYSASKLLQGLVRPITPSPDVQALVKENIIPTIGESARSTGTKTGSILGRLEDSATSIIGAGQVIQSAQRRAGIQELGRAALARATPRGIAPTERIGREGLDDTYQAISGRYDEALTRIGIVRPDKFFPHDMQQRVGAAVVGLPRERAAEAKQIIQDTIGGRNTNVSGGYTAEVSKLVDADLGARIRDFRNAANDPSARLMADAIQGAQIAWRDLIRRNAPNQATRDMLDDANRAFANYIRVERATGKSAAKGGEFNATQLNQGVRETAGGGARHAGYARGESLMEDLSDPAMKVLREQLSESGTVPRAMTAGLLASAGLGGAAYGNERYNDLPGSGALTALLLAGAASPLLYSRAASRYAIGDLLPANAQGLLAELAKASAPYAGVVGRSVYPPSKQ